MAVKRKGTTPKPDAKKAKVAEEIIEVVPEPKKEMPAKKRALAGAETAEKEAKKAKVVDTKKQPKKEEVKEEAGGAAPPTKEALAKINEQARVAVASLIKYVNEKGEKSLFPEADHGVNVLVTYKKPAVANGPSLKKNITLPHPSISASSAMFCVIMPDLDISEQARSDADVDKQAREWEERIQADHGLTRANISKILTLRQLERVYTTFADKRKLATAFDVFLVEKRVHKSATKHLGKEFVKAHKVPFIFDYSKPLGETLKKAAANTVFDLSANKMRTAVAAGHLSQLHADLVGNVEHVIASMLSACPGGIANVRSLFVQLSNSQPSLPIYADDGSASAVTLKAAPKVRPEDALIVDELTTLPEGLKVAVSKAGRVRVLREKDGAGVMYPTIHDEHTSKDGLKPKIDPKKIEKKRAVKALRKIKHREVVEKALAKSQGGEVYKRMKKPQSAKSTPVKKANKKSKKGGKRPMNKNKKPAPKAAVAAV